MRVRVRVRVRQIVCACMWARAYGFCADFCERACGWMRASCTRRRSQARTDLKVVLVHSGALMQHVGTQGETLLERLLAHAVNVEPETWGRSVVCGRGR